MAKRNAHLDAWMAPVAGVARVACMAPVACMMALIAVPVSANAQIRLQNTRQNPCVTVVRRSPVPSIPESVVMLNDELSLSPGCRVALSMDDPGRELPQGPWSYLQLVAELRQTGTASLEYAHLPRELFFHRPGTRPSASVRGGRRGLRAGASDRESVLLSRCVDLLASNAIRAQIIDRDRYCDGAVWVSADPQSCPAQLWLHDVALRDSTQSVGLCQNDVPMRELAIYAGSGRANDPVRVSLGHLETSTAGTPLQRELRTQQNTNQTPIWFSLGAAHGMLVLEPTPSLSQAPELLSELRVASLSRQLLVAVGDRVMGPAVFTDEGRYLRLQDRIWTEDLQREYGSVGRVFAPLVHEAVRAVEQVKLCIPSHYSEPTLARAPLGRRLDRRDLCVPIRLAHENTTQLRAQLGPTQVVVTQQRRLITVRGMQNTGHTRTARHTLLEGGDNNATAQVRQLEVLSVGDRISVTQTRNELYICSENGTCEPLPPGGYSLARAGVVELRRAPSVREAESAQSLALARWVVVDPWRDWVMHGLVTDGSLSAGPLWEQLRHDDDSTFSFERRVSALDSRVALSAGAVALRQHWTQGAQNVLTSDIPTLTGAGPERLGARSQSSLAVVFTRSPECPSSMHEWIDPQALSPATVFYGHLQRQDGSQWCLATTRFRVRYRRVFATSGLSSFGYLGDPRLAWFTPWRDGGAVGLIVPALFARVSLNSMFAAELSLSANVGVNLSANAAMTSVFSVTGPAVTADIRYGVITLGASLFVPQVLGVNPVRVTLEPFVSLDLGSIYELAGGR